MADRDKPRAHVLEPAAADSTCSTCKRAIAQAGLVLSEAFVSDDGRWASSHRTHAQRRQR